MKGRSERRVTAFLQVLRERLPDEAGAAETSTILAWIVVGVLVVFALQQGLEEVGNQVIDWLKDQFER